MDTGAAWTPERRRRPGVFIFVDFCRSCWTFKIKCFVFPQQWMFLFFLFLGCTYTWADARFRLFGFAALRCLYTWGSLAGVGAKGLELVGDEIESFCIKFFFHFLNKRLHAFSVSLGGLSGPQVRRNGVKKVQMVWVNLVTGGPRTLTCYQQLGAPRSVAFSHQDELFSADAAIGFPAPHDQWSLQPLFLPKCSCKCCFKCRFKCRFKCLLWASFSASLNVQFKCFKCHFDAKKLERTNAKSGPPSVRTPQMCKYWCGFCRWI